MGTVAPALHGKRRSTSRRMTRSTEGTTRTCPAGTIGMHIPEVYPVQEWQNCRAKVRESVQDTHLDKPLIPVPERVHSNTRAEVQILPPLHVPDVRALAFVQHDRRARIHGEDVRVRAVEERLHFGREGRRVLGVRHGRVPRAWLFGKRQAALRALYMPCVARECGCGTWEE